jgi:bifunctional non-homologous end joining protein LigD
MPTTTVARPPRRSARRKPAVRGTSIATYTARRDFTSTAEPPARPGKTAGPAPIFVVQKHAARRLHWDFRLEHDGVLWSWAVPKGPSLDPHDKRLAVHVEDHPLDYASFEGRIPEGQYGAGTVETWDRGTWTPVGDPDAGMRKGEIKFVLHGNRLAGGFVLVRLKPRPKERAENWLLIKEHDEAEREGADAAALEEIKLGPAPRPRKPKNESKPKTRKEPDPPAQGAVRAPMPETLSPQLATLTEEPPEGEDWISEVKFDGYRLLAFLQNGTARLVTRKGLDWTHRLPAVARVVQQVKASSAILDGELVALDERGVSSFPLLQDALSAGRSRDLFLYLFDLPYLDGWDLRRCPLIERKAVLKGLGTWRGTLRYSDHHEGNPGPMQAQACDIGLEGIICKQRNAPYQETRTKSWLKVKCRGREEFVVLGWTPPAGSRTGIGALHLGFFDKGGRLHYVGGVGTGFSSRELTELRRRLDKLAAPRPLHLLLAGDPPDSTIQWVRPELVVEVEYAGWSGSGRLRHTTYLGLREDKSPEDVVRDIPNPEAPRREVGQPPRRTAIVQASPPRRKSASARTSTPDAAPAPASGKRSGDVLEGVKLTHPDRELWPGITKRDLAEYWIAVAPYALPEIAGRPLALVRCPEGIDGEHFFQKHGKPGFPKELQAGEADGAPYLVLDGLPGLIACAQVAAIELHAWGASGADMLHPDRLVFDLDPGEGVGMKEIIAAAQDVRERLKRLGLTAFCRSSGGKGLHVVTPLTPRADWDTARAWCRAFAEKMEEEDPEHYVASVRKTKRQGRILVDWLRNGLGSTAVASFSPRARPGAGVATRLTWKEVTPDLDPSVFNLRTVPDRLKRQRRDAWDGFEPAARPLPGDLP